MSLSEIDLHVGPWTEADYFALPDDRRRIELLDGALLVDGSLLVNPSPSRKHQRVSSRLWLELERARPLGWEVMEAVNVRLESGRVLIPDLAVITQAEDEGVVIEAADVALAVEILSPSSAEVDRTLKPRLYAEAGIGCYVRIELPGPVAIVGRLVGDRYVFSEPSHLLRLDDPFRVEIDLPALLAAGRP